MLVDGISGGSFAMKLRYILSKKNNLISLTVGLRNVVVLLVVFMSWIRLLSILGIDKSK